MNKTGSVFTRFSRNPASEKPGYRTDTVVLRVLFVGDLLLRRISYMLLCFIEKHWLRGI